MGEVALESHTRGEKNINTIVLWFFKNQSTAGKCEYKKTTTTTTTTKRCENDVVLKTKL